MPVFAVFVFLNYCNRKDNLQPAIRTTTELKRTLLLLAASSANITNAVPSSSVTRCIEEVRKPSHIQTIRNKRSLLGPNFSLHTKEEIINIGLMSPPA
ncbi:hypothetical protein QL285_008170 [Trifolium repens]|nr:hypothetical protein QL285_008170 [Trifolium repens]